MFKGELQSIARKLDVDNEKFSDYIEKKINFTDLIYTPTTKIKVDEDFILFQDHVMIDDSVNLKPLKHFNEKKRAIEKARRMAVPTDYAIMNNASVEERKLLYYKRNGLQFLLPYTCVIDYDCNIGVLAPEFYDTTAACVCPNIHVDIDRFLKAQKDVPEYFKVKEKEIGEHLSYHVMNLGEYPNKYVGYSLNQELTNAYNAKVLNPTGKIWYGYLNGYEPIENEEFEYKGNKYARVYTLKYNENSILSDGSKAPESGNYSFVRVSPIWWKIRNWKDLPKSMNPVGTGKDNFIDLHSEQGLISGIPFKLFNSSWRDSIVREYLNNNFYRTAFEDITIKLNKDRVEESAKQTHLKDKIKNIKTKAQLALDSLSPYKDVSPTWGDNTYEHTHDAIEIYNNFFTF